jgi:hypothetical protein
MKEFSSAVVSAVPSGSEHDLAGSRRNALRTMHATAIFDSIADREVFSAGRGASCRLFQKEIHVVEVDDRMTIVERIDSQNTADSGAALLQRKMW